MSAALLDDVDAVGIASFSELTSVMTSQTRAEYVRDKRCFAERLLRVWLLIKRRVSRGERNPEWNGVDDSSYKNLISKVCSRD